MSRTIDLDALLKEQDDIMEVAYPYGNSPDEFMRFATARMLKIYLLKSYAIQRGEQFKGRWMYHPSFMRGVCSVCWSPQAVSKLADGSCSVCGAMNE